MRQFVYFLGITALVFTFSNSSAQNWLWAEHIKGNGGVSLRSIEVDTSEQIYLAGWFDSDLYVDTVKIDTTRGLRDMFFGKYHKNGDSLLWMKTAGGALDDNVEFLRIDDNGNLFMCGSFQDTAYFDNDSLISSGGEDVFIAAYTSDGTLDMLRNVAWGPGTQSAYSSLIDPSGNIIIVGMYIDSIFFENDTLTGSSSENSFIAKYDNAGNFIWATNIVAKDKSKMLFLENCAAGGYLTGGWSKDTLIIGNDTMPLNGSIDGFIFTFDEDGNLTCKRQAGFSGVKTKILAGTSDPAGNIYITGFADGNLTLDSTGFQLFDSHTLINNGNRDVFVAKYASDGMLQWAVNNGGTGNDEGRDLSFNNNQLVITGYVSNTTTWNTDVLTAQGYDGFIGYFTPAGAILGANQLIGSAEDMALYVAADRSGNYVCGGYFESPYLYYGDDSLTNQDPVTPVQDVFFAKFGCNMILEFSKTRTCQSHPTGTATVNVIGQGAPYSYLWSNGDTSQTADTLNETEHYVTVTNDDGCQLIGSVSIMKYPNIFPVMNVTNTTGPLASDGEVDLQVFPSDTGLTYLWSNSDDTQDISGLDTGEYSVIITQNYNTCEFYDTAVVNYACTDITLVFDSVPCCPFQVNGDATVHASGGVTPYTYAWSLPAQTDSFITDVPPGKYFITVTGDNGCAREDSVLVTAHPPFFVTITVTDATGASNDDGSIDLEVSGGTGTFDYAWNTTDSTQDLDSLLPGTYFVTVIDSSNGCIFDTSAEVNFSTLIKRLIQDECLIYPNPTNGKVNIRVQQDAEITVFNTLGKAIMRFDAYDDLNTVNLKGYRKGLYIIQVKTKEMLIRKPVTLE